jgi:hypothetical protein
MSSSTFEPKNIRMPGVFYRGTRLYFLTFCFAHRRRYGSNARIAPWIINRLCHRAQECAFFTHGT